MGQTSPNYPSAPLDGPHLWAAIRYIELNPVRAGLVARAEDWPWSSAAAHAGGALDPLLDAARPFGAPPPDPLDGRPRSWSEWLAAGLAAQGEIDALREATRTGRPLGDAVFLARLETELARRLAPQKRGPKTPAPDMSEEFPGFF